MLPQRMIYKNIIFLILNKILTMPFWHSLFSKYDTIIFSSPKQLYLLPFFTGKTIIFLISDPYHMMGYEYDYEKILISRADIILATSMNIKNKYLKKYFNHTKENVFYWPNTVDLDIWRPEMHLKRRVRNKPIVIGYLGNVNEINFDSNLFDFLTMRYKDVKFQIAGKINFKEDDEIRYINEIFRRENVEYLGWFPFDEISKIVASWDVGIALDRKTEVASYHHHNKIYQYLALGKPVVVYKNHDDYNILSNVIFLSDSFEEFSENVQKAIKRIDDEMYMQECIKTAQENSSVVRAKEVMNIIEKTKAINTNSIGKE